MQRYVLRRLLMAVPTIFGITVLIFVAMRVLPGDPLAQIANEGRAAVHAERGGASPPRAPASGSISRCRSSTSSGSAMSLHGDLGHSFWNKEPIRAVDRAARGDLAGDRAPGGALLVACRRAGSAS